MSSDVRGEPSPRRTWFQWSTLVIAAVVVTVLGVLPFARGESNDNAKSVGASTEGRDGASSPSASIGGSASGGAAGNASATQPNGSSTHGQSGTAGSSASGPETTLGARSGGGAVAGITDDKITIGIGWFDVNSFAQLFAPGADDQGGTTKDAAQAVIDWLNKRGGIAGRQIVPIYHEYPLQDVVGSNSSRSAQEQSMCSDFTEDHHAFAAIPWIASQSVFYECAAQHNLVSIATSFSEGLVDRTMFDHISNVFYMPHSLLIDRREEMMVKQLDRRGFFPQGAKVGVIVEDTPQQRRGADRSLFPALKALGVNVAATAYYVPELSTDWSNMVLRFRSAGVTHVLWGASACSFICAGQFMTASENQRYRPFNALGSDQGIPGQTLVTPEAQRERIVGISWSPLDDGDAYETAKPANDADAQCREVKKSSGKDLDQFIFVPYCDGLFLIKQALESGPNLSPDAFRTTVEAPGFAYPVIDAFSAAWGPGRHDGANAVRDISYNAECECFRFSGPVHSLG